MESHTGVILENHLNSTKIIWAGTKANRNMVGPELNSKQDKIEKIEAIRQPKWCIQAEEGRLYWKLIGAAIKDDVKTIQSSLAENPSSAKLEYWYTPPPFTSRFEKAIWRPLEYCGKLISMKR